jgi:PAS domain S-box-containing protein
MTGQRLPAQKHCDMDEKIFREVTEGLPLIVWVHGPSGEQELVNQTFCEFFGVTREEMQGGRWQMLMHPDDGEAYLSRFRECVRDRSPFTAEVRVKRADGEWRWIESWGKPRFASNGDFRGFIGTSADITDRKEAEVALRESEERLELALVAGRNGTWDWDMAQDKATVSDSYLDLYGYPHDHEVTYDSWLAAVHPEDQDRVRRYAEKFFQSGREWRLDYRIVHPELGTRWMEAVGRVHRDAGGRPVRFVGVQSDATERKKAEIALREADRRKDEFLAVLGHELRNPLASLSTGVELLEQARITPGLIESVQPMMRRQVDHLSRLVDDLLDLSRITRGHVELQRAPLDLREAIHTAVEQCGPLIDARHHKIDVELGGSPLRIDGDFQRLTQVFGNFFSNAAKYSDPRGQITVRASREGDVALVHIADKGFGIPKEQLKKVFQMFHQVPEHRSLVGGGGLGIGLALTLQLVELHGGSIDVRSEGLGHGSEFVVRLPLVSANDYEVRACSSEEPANQSYRRVLVVDDNVDAADMLCMRLQLEGHDVQSVYDGPSALEMMDSFAPEVVLLDLGLPRMDGFEVLHRIRAMKNGKDMLVVALTGWGQDEDRQRTMEAGFDEHLTKPVDPARLCALLAAESSQNKPSAAVKR